MAGFSSFWTKALCTDGSPGHPLTLEVQKASGFPSADFGAFLGVKVGRWNRRFPFKLPLEGNSLWHNHAVLDFSITFWFLAQFEWHISQVGFFFFWGRTPLHNNNHNNTNTNTNKPPPYCLGVTSSFFPGILLSRKPPQKTSGTTDLVFENNDG